MPRQAGSVRSNDPSERRSGVPPGCSEASRRAVAWSGTIIPGERRPLSSVTLVGRARENFENTVVRGLGCAFLYLVVRGLGRAFLCLSVCLSIYLRARCSLCVFSSRNLSVYLWMRDRSPRLLLFQIGTNSSCLFAVVDRQQRDVQPQGKRVPSRRPREAGQWQARDAARQRHSAHPRAEDGTPHLQPLPKVQRPFARPLPLPNDALLDAAVRRARARGARQVALQAQAA